MLLQSALEEAREQLAAGEAEAAALTQLSEGLLGDSGAALVERQAVGERVLSELVARYAQQLIASAAVTAHLIDFERPRFHNQLQRAMANATSTPTESASRVRRLMASGGCSRCLERCG